MFVRSTSISESAVYQGVWTLSSQRKGSVSPVGPRSPGEPEGLSQSHTLKRKEHLNSGTPQPSCFAVGWPEPPILAACPQAHAFSDPDSFWDSRDNLVAPFSGHIPVLAANTAFGGLLITLSFWKLPSLFLEHPLVYVLVFCGVPHALPAWRAPGLRTQP